MCGREEYVSPSGLSVLPINTISVRAIERNYLSTGNRHRRRSSSSPAELGKHGGGRFPKGFIPREHSSGNAPGRSRGTVPLHSHDSPSRSRCQGLIESYRSLPPGAVSGENLEPRFPRNLRYSRQLFHLIFLIFIIIIKHPQKK